MYRYIRHIEKIEELDVLSYFTILSKASERCSYSVPGNTRPGDTSPGNTRSGNTRVGKTQGWARHKGG